MGDRRWFTSEEDSPAFCISSSSKSLLFAKAVTCLLNCFQTKEALARREEMLQLIGKRNTDTGGPSRPRVHTMFESSSSSSSLLSNGSSRSSQTEDLAQTVEGLADEADQQLDQALRNQDMMVADIKLLTQLLKQVRLLDVVFHP